MLLRTSSSGKTYLSCVCFVSCVVVWVVWGVKTFVYQLIVVKTGGLLNINQYIYIFYHIHLSEAQMKQVMLSESIENILGFSRKRVIAICDNILGSLQDIGANHIITSMLVRNLHLFWTSRFLVVTTPVSVATQQSWCCPYLWWGIWFAKNPVWFCLTSLWKNWRPSLRFSMAVATGLNSLWWYVLCEYRCWVQK